MILIFFLFMQKEIMRKSQWKPVPGKKNPINFAISLARTHNIMK